MFNTFSLPGFQCIDGLLLPEHLQLSVGRNSDSKRLLSCSFWNWIVNDFSSIFHYHDQMIVHQIYWMHIMIYFSFSTDSIIPWIALLNKCSLFIFTQFISHLQRKENSCYIMLKFLFCVVFCLFSNDISSSSSIFIK